jgi:hypothetical protein
VSARSTTIHIGTDAISSAASPDATFCWAMVTSPFPHAGSSRPARAVVPNCGQVIRNALRPANAATSSASNDPPTRNRTPLAKSGGRSAMMKRLAR